MNIDSLTSGRFSFVEHGTLRTNIAINVQYITFLLSLEAQYDVPGPIVYSIYKDVITHTAAVVESLLCYQLMKMCEQGKVVMASIMPEECRYLNEKVLYTISLERSVVGAEKVCAHATLREDTQFIHLNRAAKKAGLIDDDLYDRIDELRMMRNKVHLAGLKNVDDQYTKKETDRIFETARLLVDRVKSVS